MNDSLKCPECDKLISSFDTSKTFIHCPFCQIRILIPKNEPRHHLSFHERDLNDVITRSEDDKPIEKHSKLKVRKERGANTQKIDPLE